MSSYLGTNLTDYAVTTVSYDPYTNIATTSTPFNQPGYIYEGQPGYIYTEPENGWNWQGAGLNFTEKAIKEAVRNALKEENTLVVPKIEKYRIKHR